MTREAYMRIRNNIIDWVLNGVCMAVMVAVTVLTVVRWNELPDRIATQFGMNGEPQGYGGKGNLIAILVVMFIMFIGITLTEYFPKLWNLPVKVTESNCYVVYRLTKYFIETIKLLLVICLAVLITCTVLQRNIPVWYTPVELVSIFAAIIIWLVIIVVQGKRY